MRKNDLRFPLIVAVLGVCANLVSCGDRATLVGVRTQNGHSDSMPESNAIPKKNTPVSSTTSPTTSPTASPTTSPTTSSDSIEIQRSNSKFNIIDPGQLASAQQMTISEYITSQVKMYLTKNPTQEDRNIFANYDIKGKSEWTNNWLSAYDFSGVAWDVPQCGTLITTQHMVLAKHFQRSVGDTVTFHDKKGNRVTRKITAVAALSDTDIAIAKLDSPVPDSIAIYPLLGGDSFVATQIVGSLLLVTDQNRMVYVHKVASVSSSWFVGEKNSDLPDYMSKFAVSGDSGNPHFVVVGGKLALASLHTFASYGKGANYANKPYQDAIAEFILKM